tara:strand:+ start:5062 stop:5253 length:192 start_codon:yes stop_codon:yes gene_type:complete
MPNNNELVMTVNKKKVEINKPVLPEAKAGQKIIKKTPKEHGGREGPDPTRFGDWEKGGRCIDF